MRDSLPFLVRLGLDADTDSRAIRKAYARELKLIDQSADPDAFQELREAYEVALRWHEHMEWERQQEAQQPDAVEEPSPPTVEETPVPALEQAAVPIEPQFEDPRQLAASAFDKFMSSCRVLAASKDLHNHEIWAQVLRRRLTDDVLLNIMARAMFEANIVHLLANGWQPGHETLFVAAAEVFEWSTDRRRLPQFGYVGGLLNRALEERQMFDAQEDNSLIVAQRKAIADLRRPTEPTDLELRRSGRALHSLLTRFPTWLGVITDAPKARHWHERLSEISAARGAAIEVDEALLATVPKESWWQRLGNSKYFIIFALITLARMLGSMEPSAVHNSHPVTQAAQPYYVPPQPDKPVTQDRIDEINSRIKYNPSKNESKGEREAQYDVFIDADGAVLGANFIRSSGDKAYDAAVLKAIRETKNFPPGTTTRFRLRFHLSFGHGTHTPADSVAPFVGTKPPKDYLKLIEAYPDHK